MAFAIAPIFPFKIKPPGAAARSMASAFADKALVGDSGALIFRAPVDLPVMALLDEMETLNAQIEDTFDEMKTLTTDVPGSCPRASLPSESKPSISKS